MGGCGRPGNGRRIGWQPSQNRRGGRRRVVRVVSADGRANPQDEHDADGRCKETPSRPVSAFHVISLFPLGRPAPGSCPWLESAPFSQNQCVVISRPDNGGNVAPEALAEAQGSEIPPRRPAGQKKTRAFRRADAPSGLACIVQPSDPVPVRQGQTPNAGKNRRLPLPWLCFHLWPTMGYGLLSTTPLGNASDHILPRCGRTPARHWAA